MGYRTLAFAHSPCRVMAQVPAALRGRVCVPRANWRLQRRPWTAVAGDLLQLSRCSSKSSAGVREVRVLILLPLLPRSMQHVRWHSAEHRHAAGSSLDT